MCDKSTRIADLFRIPSRFLRSVQIERDFSDPRALDDYIVTTPMRDAFGRVADGLKSDSGRRAWRITGDYGVGKSAFALMLAHVFRGKACTVPSRISETLGIDGNEADRTPALFPILLTGSRSGLVHAIARSVGKTVLDRKADGRKVRFVQRVATLVAMAEATGSVSTLEELIDAVREQLHKEGDGLLLVVDELGKHLEFAAARPESEDVFILQRLAEMAARSGNKPFVLVGLLHQGFQAYAEKLPSNVRHEWDKVAGRFDEIVFDQPLAHTAAIVAGALDVDVDRLSPMIAEASSSLAAIAIGTGWFGAADGTSLTTTYPLQPTMLPVVVRFFGRFGQNERSLFGFLLSSEPWGLQAFSDRSASAATWYGLPEFYDYVRAFFGHRLAGGSYRSQWLRILSVVDGAADLDELEIRVLKTVAVLNLLDADDLAPTSETIRACLAPEAGDEVDLATLMLKKRGLLFERGRGGILRLWPNSSIGLENALAAANRALGPLKRVSAELAEHLDREPILARRHYLATGTMRYFDLRYAQVEDMPAASARPYEGDGLILVVLADTETERRVALAAAADPQLGARMNVLVCVGEPLIGLAPELQELKAWKWICENTPELAEDTFASSEVFRQLARSRSELARRLQELTGLKRPVMAGIRWFRGGREITPPGNGGVSTAISAICSDLYGSSPQIANELLNRSQLSSAATAARMRLIEGLFTSDNLPFLGIDTIRNPPEKSMYLSVLAKGRVHVRDGDGFKVVEPTTDDPLRLGPAIAHLIKRIVDARGARIPADALLECMKEQPFGVRAGVAPLLMAIVFRTRSHELAFFERGTFLHRFGPSDFLRLLKAPSTFEVQLCKVEGVRLDVFRRLADAFATATEGRSLDLLDVVRPLCRFAAQLPEYTRKTSALSQDAIAVRDALLSAREPSRLLFFDLPTACGLETGGLDADMDAGIVGPFVERLEEAIAELRAAYPKLLNRIVDRVAESILPDSSAFNRTELAAVAAEVSSIASDPRLKAFAGRLRDPGLSDESWAEALASFVISKPPTKWGAGDEARFGEEVAALAKLFKRANEASFSQIGGRRVPKAILLNLTRGDGSDRSHVMMPQGDMDAETESLTAQLPTDRAKRMRLLVEILWKELDHQGQEAPEACYHRSTEAVGNDR